MAARGMNGLKVSATPDNHCVSSLGEVQKNVGLPLPISV